FAGFIRQVTLTMGDDVIDEFWKAYADADRRQNHLDLYRSGEFRKLEPYRGKLAALGVPTLIVWGAKDEFAPVAGGYRFHKEIPGSTPIVLEDAGHFLIEVDAVLEQAAGMMHTRGVECECHARKRGDPADAILDVAEEQDADLIVIGSKGMQGTKRFLLGSVPNKISHHASCSVLIVRTT